MLKNPSFEDGWTDLPPAPGNLTNQQPAGWTLRWLEPGESLFGSSDTAGGVPECVHKLATQLPPEEQPGGADPLILDGTTVYKVFHAGAAFGAELRQTVTGLQPGSQATVRVPVRCHRHGDGDPWAAEAGVWLGDAGRWWNADALGDRRWNTLEVSAAVPASGEVEVLIRFKSKWGRPKDFFIDDITFEATPAGNGNDGDDDDGGNGEQPPMDMRELEKIIWNASEAYQRERGVTFHPRHGLEIIAEEMMTEIPGLQVAHTETTIDTPVGRVGIMKLDHVRHKVPSMVLWFRRPWSGPAGVNILTDPDALLLQAPVGTAEERASGKIWPGDWEDANPYGSLYNLRGKMHYHTGADLNLNKPAWDSDRGQPVYAVANGTVTFAGRLPDWGNVVVIRHELPGLPRSYSRSAHLGQVLVGQGDEVRRGEAIGTIGQDAHGGPYHLHFDISLTDVLATRPHDWPGADRARVLRDYTDPKAFLANQGKVEAPVEPAPPQPQTIDLLPYLRGDGRAYMVRHPKGAEEKFRTVQDGARWLQLKNSQFEEFWLSDGYIWRGVDTSAGEGNYYRQFEHAAAGARWCPRLMYVGQTWVSPVQHRVQTYRKSDCAPVQHHRNGSATNRVTLVARHVSRTWNGITVQDVLELLTSTGETMFFARGYGLVAWKSGWGESAIAKLLPAGEADNQPERGCFN